jgi:aspartyl-tRNA(Asn)/glutamyl-tRNA(Gln) amidotransferase subunit C
MSLTTDDVKKIAHLARLNMPADDLANFTSKLSGIFEFAAQMNQIDTDHIEPLAHPLDISQRLRPDEVTEPNQREAAQKIAPEVEAGLYLVPQVIDAE